jgi:papain like protease
MVLEIKRLESEVEEDLDFGYPGIYPLGRHVEHDSRSLNYAHGVLPKSAIKSVRWKRVIPILDQGNLGSCTGNAGTGILGTAAQGYTGYSTITITKTGAEASRGFFSAGVHELDETFAKQLYSLSTKLDEISGSYPPEDTGSSGIGTCKALKALGLAAGYTHAFSIDALKSALQNSPVMVGINWYESMFDPQSDGRIVVTPKSGLAGGHELEVVAYDLATQEFTLANSWGRGWGNNGYGYLTETDMSLLLSKQGDVTVPNLNTAPVPTPTPSPSGADVDVLSAYRSLKAWAIRNGVV